MLGKSSKIIRYNEQPNEKALDGHPKYPLVSSNDSIVEIQLELRESLVCFVKGQISHILLEELGILERTPKDALQDVRMDDQACSKAWFICGVA